jgi:hypothetical protein
MNNKVWRKYRQGNHKTEPTTEVLTTPSILSGVAPVIVDLITIYDSDPEGTDTAVLIVDETM